jgi:NDP-sugar pyrophosphorylase family protein
MSKRAIILAGGKGTRLKPFTVSMPKPLVPVGSFPILEIIIRQLVHHGFSHITLTVSHQADIVRAYFEDGKKWKATIDYSFEDMPLGTMGPLTLISDLPEDFIVMNGDVLTNLDYNEFFKEHTKKNNLFTISGFRRTIDSEFGVLEVNRHGVLTAFQEKPKIHYFVSMGVYAVNRRILDYIPRNKNFGFDQLMLALIARKNPAHVRMFDGYWLDIGRPEDYESAITAFEQNPSYFLPHA